MKREFPLSEIVPSDPSALQEEWAFLCSCASPHSTSEEFDASIIDRLNWSAFFELAEEHGVQGLVAKRLERMGFVGVPTAAREKLQSRIRLQHLFTLSMIAELFRILKDFSAARIDTVLVKGPVISFLAYGDPAVRNYVDLDLLLRQRDIQTAAQRMLAMGFVPEVPESVMRAGKIPGEYLFQRPGTHCVVELHTERTFRYYPKPMRIEDLLSRSRKVPLDGREVPALSLEDELVLGCIHGAKHFWERLIWISDVASLVARHPELDWEKAKQAAAQVGAARILRVGIRLASSLLRIELPSGIAKEIYEDRSCDLLLRHIQTWLPYAGAAPPPLLRRAKFRWKMGGGGTAGASYLMRLSLSPTQEDWVEGAANRRSWLWDAARRPFRLFRKYGSNQ